MKIGIFCDETLPQRGGGFVLKKEIINGLVNLNSKEFEFVFFAWNSNSFVKDLIDRENFYYYLHNPHNSFYEILKGFKYRFSIINLCKDFTLLCRGHFHQIISNYLMTYVMNTGYIRCISEFEKQLKLKCIDVCLFLEPTEVFVKTLPYVCINWDLAHFEDPYFPEILAGDWNQFISTKLNPLRRAMRVINGTSVLSNQVFQHAGVPLNRMKVLPFPTPGDALEFNYRKPNNTLLLSKLGINKRFLFYPASFWPHKNHALLVRTASKIVGTDYDYDFVFCGADKGNKDFVQSLAKDLGVYEKFHFFDFLDRETVLELYLHACALIFPSFIGPDNIPPLEAFALGCPVIASKLSGSLEQMQDAAYLFDPSDEEELIDGIRSLSFEKKAWEVRKAKGKQIANSWSSLDYATELSKVFKELVPLLSCCSTSKYKFQFS